MTWQLRLLVIGASLAAAFWAGREWRDRSCDLAVSQMETRTLQAESDLMDAWIDVARAQIDTMNAEKAAREAKARVITKRVIEYVQSPDAGQCDLPDSWVLLHDDAWRNAAPAGAAQPAFGADRRITDTEALTVTAGNAETCGRAISIARGWQEWWDALQDAKNE